MATATAPLQTVTHARLVKGTSYVTLSCGHCTQSREPLVVGDRYQCRAQGCQDAVAQAERDAQRLAHSIYAQLDLRTRGIEAARRNAASTGDLQAQATSLQDVLAHLATLEQRP